MSEYEAILDCVPNLGLRNISLAFARDFEALRLSCQFPFNEEDFKKKFSKFECMHYAPLFDFISRPYSRNTTRALLFVAAGYLTIPLSVSVEALEFGIRLCSHIFFTQPRLRELHQTGVPIWKYEENDENDDENNRRENNDDENAANDNEDDANQNNNNSNKPSKRKVEFHYDHIRVDRIAKIPLPVDVAIRIANLGNQKLLSSESIQHFKMLKENDAFSLCCPGKLRYGDVAIWAICLANDPKISRSLSRRPKINLGGVGAARQPATRSIFNKSTAALDPEFIKRLKNAEQEFGKLALKEDDAAVEEQPTVADMSIVDALNEYEQLKSDLGCDEIFDNSDSSGDENGQNSDDDLLLTDRVKKEKTTNKDDENEDMESNKSDDDGGYDDW